MYIETATSQSRNSVQAMWGVGGAPTIEELFKTQPTETISPGEAIFWEADPADHIYAVKAGVMRVFRILSDGRRAIIGFLYPGDVVGVSFQDRYLFTAEAVTDVEFRKFPRGRFFSLVNESPALRSQLFSKLCDEMSAAQDQMLLLGRKSAEERVVSFLLAVHRKSGAGAAIELPMSRLDIADYLGLTMETVSRMMTSLSRRGLTGASGRHTVSLRKLAALREIAGDDGAMSMESRISPPPRRAVWPN